jgi:hypothetical protein
VVRSTAKGCAQKRGGRKLRKQKTNNLYENNFLREKIPYMGEMF